MDLGPATLNALNTLLSTPGEDSDSEDEKPESAYRQLGPGDIGPSAPDSSKKASEIDESQNAGHGSKDIWDKNAVPEGSEFASTVDPRPQPEYEIIYKQAVTSEDIFLQMGNKSPASASCEEMVVKIQLPHTKMNDVELDVKSAFLDCRAPKFYLGLHLPHPVDPKSGKAQWDGKNSTLVVNLKMRREYDFMNF